MEIVEERTKAHGDQHETVVRTNLHDHNLVVKEDLVTGGTTVSCEESICFLNESTKQKVREFVKGQR